MYIDPNSTIELFRDLKIDNSYKNTMWFSDVNAQNTFFSNKKDYTLSNQMYQRKTNGLFRCSLPIGTCYDLNYMRFKNSSFENKWFYAFITKIEYINNGRCDLTFLIDVIQTYMFDWDLNPCMIERRHSSTDIAGDNLQPEGLELGDAICDGSLYEYVFTITTSSALLWCAGEDVHDGIASFADSVSEATVISGLPTPIYGYAFDYNGTSGYNGLWNSMEWLQENNKVDNIVSVTMLPTGVINFSSSSPVELTHTETKPTSLNSHTPVNKKLLTYPYCYLKVYNDNGNEIDYRYELFNTNDCEFKTYGCVSTTPELICVPETYDSNNKPIKYALSSGDFCQIPYYTDGYKSWLALNYDQTELNKGYYSDILSVQNQVSQVRSYQNAFNGIMGGTGAVIGGVASFATGDIVGGANSIVSGISSVGNSVYQDQLIELNKTNNELDANYRISGANISESVAKKLPSTSNGGRNDSHTAIGKKGFFFQKMSIRKQFAERIDKYFTMFGYAHNIVETPNIHVRTRFTFIKTSGSCVSGNIPQDDREIIDTVFDRGIRFWTSYSDFENYDSPNPIIS